MNRSIEYYLRTYSLVLIACSFFALACLSDAKAQEKGTVKNRVLITNVHVFDGVNEQRIENANVLVEGNLIQSVSTKPMAADGATVIDGKGRTLLPGLSDAHTHIMWNDEIEHLIYGAPEGYSGVLAAKNAEDILMRGFTTVRDLGGPSFGLKRAIDDGIVAGPRILPAGAFVSQSSGHGDFDTRKFYLSPHFTGQIDKAYIRGWTIIADGVPEVQKATREILRSGASQIKVFGSGSITGAHDPIDANEYTIEELKAIVKETEHWGTYAAAHVYSDAAVNEAIDAGIKSIEHGLFASEATMRKMKEKDVFLSTQFYSFSVTPAEAGFSEGSKAAYSFQVATARAAKGFRAAKKVGVKLAFGTDMLGSLNVQRLRSQEFNARSKYFTPYEILVQATSANAELFELSGNRHPYREGKLGVIREGAYADLLIVDGNPLENIQLLVEPKQNLLLIMKDGVIHKNEL